MKQSINEVARFRKIAGLIKEDTNVATQIIDQIKQAMEDGELDSKGVEQILNTVGHYYREFADELTNMDAMSISNDILKAAQTLANRDGN